MIIIIYTVILLLIALSTCLFFGLLIIFSIDSVINRHDLPTSRRAVKAIQEIIHDYKTAENFYDLGCARGALAIRIKQKFPEIDVCAIDNNPTRIFFAKIRAFISRTNVKFLRKDIFEIDLRNADIVYTYLWYAVMPPLEKKLQKELKKGAIVITNTSNFLDWKPVKKIVTCSKVYKNMPDFETLFVYEK